tara:strand:- start:13675 stop:13902 length:228 start_codon:yes stop_codon:yes gene_type:complete
MYLKNNPNISALKVLKNPLEDVVVSGSTCNVTVNKMAKIIPKEVIMGMIFLLVVNKSTTMTMAAKSTTVISGDNK